VIGFIADAPKIQDFTIVPLDDLSKDRSTKTCPRTINQSMIETAFEYVLKWRCLEFFTYLFI
jgi:hypothetical protein